MERLKRLFLLIIMITGMLFLTGCNILRFDFFDGSKEENDSVITLTPSQDQKDNILANTETENSTTNSTNQSEVPTPTPTDIQPTANVELPLFTLNIDTGEIEALTAIVPADAKITPELIVDKVVESMADRSIEVGIEDISTEGSAIIVSFYKNKAPLGEMGAGYEGAILDAIAQSLIDNLNEYNKVIYRAEGEPYVSGHFEFGINDVYLEDN